MSMTDAHVEAALRYPAKNGGAWLNEQDAFIAGARYAGGPLLVELEHWKARFEIAEGALQRIIAMTTPTPQEIHTVATEAIEQTR